MTIIDDTESDEVVSISPAIEEMKRDILGELKKREAGRWKTTVALPIILTSALGLLVWVLQMSIEQKLEKEAGRLASQLNLAQHLYKQRLKIYEQLYVKVLAVEASFEGVKRGKTNLDRLYSNIRAMDGFHYSNKLLVSKELDEKLDDIWLNTALALRRKIQQDSIKKTLGLKEEIEAQMRKDLYIDELSPKAIFESMSAR